MSLLIDKNGHRVVTESSQFDSLLADRREIDQLNNAISSDEFIIFDLSGNDLGTMTKYMYTVALRGLLDGRTIDVYHNVIATAGNPQTLSNIVLSTGRFLDPEGETYIGNMPVYDIVDCDLSTDEGLTYAAQTIALVIAYHITQGKKPILYVPENMDVPYILNYLSSVIKISKEMFHEQFRRVSLNNETVAEDKVEEPAQD